MITTEISLELYGRMYRIRKSEEKIIEEYFNDAMKTPMHMSMGSEAIAAGVCTALDDAAQIWGTYRSHATYLARTKDVNGFFTELYGKVTGPGGGKAGSMHLADPEQGLVMASAVVATNISPALGAAFANKILKNHDIAVTFFGDGAVDEGVFWESINLASVLSLPVLFVYEDNGLAIHTSAKSRHGYDNIGNLIKQYANWHYLEYGGTDVEEIFQLTANAYFGQLMRGPVFLSLKYYRYLEHVGVNEDFKAGYRSREEFEKWQKIDPLTVQKNRLTDLGLAKEVSRLETEILNQIEEAVTYAKSSPYPEPGALYEGVYDDE